MSKKYSYPWNILNVDKIPSDIREVKRAYARQLKLIDRSNVDEFQQLQQAYQYALTITDDKPVKESMRSMSFTDISAEDTEESFKSFPKKNQLKDLSLSSENEDPEKPNLRDLTITYEAIEDDEYEGETLKHSKAPNIYNELADPRNLTLKKWQEILHRADINSLQERSKIELYILTILSNYLVNIEGILKFDRIVPINLIAYLKDNFDFEKHHRYHDQNITNVLIAFSAKYNNNSRFYFSYFCRFILYGFSSIVFILAAVLGTPLSAAILVLIAWAALHLASKIMLSRLKRLFVFLLIIAIIGYIIATLFDLEHTTKALFAFVFFGLFTLSASFSYSHFPQERGIFHLSFSIFHSWNCILMLSILPKIASSFFVETTLPSYMALYTIIATICYGYYFIFSEESSWITLN